MNVYIQHDTGYPCFFAVLDLDREMDGHVGHDKIAKETATEKRIDRHTERETERRGKIAEWNNRIEFGMLHTSTYSVVRTKAASRKHRLPKCFGLERWMPRRVYAT